MAWLHAHARHLLCGVVAVVALTGVFMAYTDPHLMLELANRVWACF